MTLLEQVKFEDALLIIATNVRYLKRKFFERYIVLASSKLSAQEIIASFDEAAARRQGQLREKDEQNLLFAIAKEKIEKQQDGRESLILIKKLYNSRLRGELLRKLVCLHEQKEKPQEALRIIVEELKDQREERSFIEKYCENLKKKGIKDIISLVKKDFFLTQYADKIFVILVEKISHNKSVSDVLDIIKNINDDRKKQNALKTFASVCLYSLSSLTGDKVKEALAGIETIICVMTKNGDGTYDLRGQLVSRYIQCGMRQDALRVIDSGNVEKKYIQQLIRACIEEGELDTGFSLLPKLDTYCAGELIKDWSKDDLMKDFAVAYIKSGRKEKALEMIQAISQNHGSERRIALYQAITTCIERSEKTFAMDLLHRVRFDDLIDPRLITSQKDDFFRAVAECCIRYKHFSEAKELAHNISSKEIRERLLQSICV